MNAQDTQLLNTQFSPEIEKLAQEKIATIQLICAMGQEEAMAAADELEKTAQAQFEAAEQAEAEQEAYENASHQEKVASENFVKTANELGAFYERTFTETLEKLGQERYNDPSVYLIPYMREKVAHEAAENAVAEFDEAIEKLAANAKAKAAKGMVETVSNKLKSFGESAKSNAKAFGKGAKNEGAKTKAQASGTMDQVKQVFTGTKANGKKKPTQLTGSQRAQIAGSLATKAAIPTAIGAAGAGAGYMAGRN